MAKWLIVVGVLLVLVGLVWHYFPNALNWFGKLPGDLRYEGENSRVFIPITSMVIVSVVLSLLVHLLKRFME